VVKICKVWWEAYASGRPMAQPPSPVNLKKNYTIGTSLLETRQGCKAIETTTPTTAALPLLPALASNLYRDWADNSVGR